MSKHKTKIVNSEKKSKQFLVIFPLKITLMFIITFDRFD